MGVRDNARIGSDAYRAPAFVQSVSEGEPFANQYRGIDVARAGGRSCRARARHTGDRRRPRRRARQHRAGRRGGSRTGVVVRPHTKTHKLPQIAHMQLEAGAVGVQVAKLGEAEVMADAGIGDILVGYPIVGEQKLARLADLAERVVRLRDRRLGRGRRGDLARGARARADDPACWSSSTPGMHRLGVLPGPAAADLAERVAALPGIELARRLHPRGTRLHAGAGRRREGAPDAARPAGRRSRPPRRSAAAGSPRPSSLSARQGRSASRPLPGGHRGAAGNVRLQRPQPDRPGRGDGRRPRGVRRRDRRQPARRPTASSSTPARRSSPPTGCSSPTRPPSFGRGVGARRLGRRRA